MAAVLGFLLRQDKDLLTTCFFDLARLSIWLPWRVPEGSAGELHWAIHAWRLLDRVGFGRAHPCFTLAVWFQRERFEAVLAVFIMEHAFSFHGAGGE